MERVEERRSDVSLPYALALIAGVLIIIGGLSTFAMMSWSQNMFGMSGMMGGGWQMFMRGYYQPYSLAMAGVGLAAGAAVILGAYKLREEPSNAGLWGFLILIGSIVALFCIGGFGIAAILGIVAGMVAMTRR